VSLAVQGATAYRRIEAQSRSPLELVVMLYDGALRFVTEAREATAAHQPHRRARAVSRALAVIGELQSTLNLDEGGTVAAELDRLYTYMTGRLVDVSTRKDDTALDEVHRLLLPLREAWSEVARQAGKPVPS
jgi:flagellar protein FliS